MSLDIPDQLRMTVIADGNEGWLDELPGVVDSLAQDWSLTIGSSFAGGHVALVVEATLVDGTPVILKIGVPNRDLGPEATALRLANGDGCAKLLGEDLDRQALLLERLGTPMRDLETDPARRHDLLCDMAVRLWRPLAPDIDLPTGAQLAEQYADRLPALWEQAGRPCTPATVADALDCMHRRRLAHDDRSAVLVHGDIHELNALQADDGSYKLIDPLGLRAEPACDLGTVVRCTPDLGDDLRARTERLARRTGVEATAIWEWGTIHRVMSGVYAYSIGFQPFGELLLAEADRLTAGNSRV
ncbi:aminoglycoside phosphotransferase family protein [Kribbella sp. CA-293567]|uniref:aminoglycoside phosphotransferase family protein n=1 Tax=Kribbella sp. CA-293567 TaxID=3002436 RepID=UPI0022DD979B|nr:aminoglycoside phosphotransferase family protein [Kribbella sp. CA-293567]WBQ07925.1 phosphotransferase [Kribbella sp. CA-293567]